MNTAMSPQMLSSIMRSKHDEVGESSQRQPNQTKVESSDGEATRIIRQQGRKNFFEIVCTHRQLGFVSDRDKKRALCAAIEFYLKLEKYKFMRVMCAVQVYHSFYLVLIQTYNFILF